MATTDPFNEGPLAVQRGTNTLATLAETEVANAEMANTDVAEFAAGGSAPMAGEFSEQVAGEPMTDELLLRQFVESGNRAAFETLVRRYQSEIYNYLRRYMGDDDQAEDAFQLTFVKVYKKVEQFDLERRFRPWLYGIATHQAIDLKRRNKRRLHASLDVSSTSDDSYGASQSASIPDHRNSEQDPLEVEELRVKLRTAIEEVGEPGRSALELIYLNGLPYRDAAEILDVPVGTVKSRVHAAVRKLANIWKRKEEGSH